MEKRGVKPGETVLSHYTVNLLMSGHAASG